MTALDFPTSPSNGDTYQNYVYDSTAGVWKRFTAGLDLNDITDVTLTSPTDGQALVYDNATSNWVNGEGSSVPVAVSETAPVSPEVGELWLNSTEAKMYVYYDDGTSAQWVAAVGGTVPSQGKILQVVSTSKTDIFSTTSTSFTDVTGLSATITPSSASSKIFVIFQGYWGASQGAAAIATLVRDSTVINAASGRDYFTYANIGENTTLREFPHPLHVSYLDSPATTSAVTYKIQVRITAGTLYVNRGAVATTYATSSTITVMEVAG